MYDKIFTTKDSGKRAEFDSGMVRDTQDGKARFDLLFPLGVPFKEQMLTRLADLMERGAQKYTERNWEKANSQEELDRYKSSAVRHLIQWLTGETDEDHAAAVMFNIIAHETISLKLKDTKLDPAWLTKKIDPVLCESTKSSGFDHTYTCLLTKGHSGSHVHYCKHGFLWERSWDDA